MLMIIVMLLLVVAAIGHLISEDVQYVCLGEYLAGLLAER
jgi:hypothetical protein